MATARRFIPTKWCTGEDSNLRTSLGGTDLQSVGFNHSPTCAETFGRCGRRVVRQTAPFIRRTRKAELRMKTQHITLLYIAKQENQGRAQEQPRRSLHAGNKAPKGV